MLPREQRVAEIRRRLDAAFSPASIEVIDDSHKHAGHEGARDGRGHFTVHISAAAFRGQSPLAQHRAIYAALGELMSTDIHALAIRSGAPAA
ncbi:MAG: BolA family transcriptional regulator [Rhodanobacteraceae bacterium]|nr:BolA family transcriptional regulator [Rhodanobacteraceae bacterium]MBL0041503.1 BolA family transcriptional regulator [Xanthomonadales bacterium]MBP6078165.1 BolA family transcriptional regulator [Xanthomonadales bacterium]MBP7622884.1 BolA family transcriptional regulator [Xanthomonadales bacterium]